MKFFTYILGETVFFSFWVSLSLTCMYVIRKLIVTLSTTYLIEMN